MPRVQDLDILRPALARGPLNAITDVGGVAVGQQTIIEGEGAWRGHGPFRTGVSVILPHDGNLYEEKVPAAVYRINGFGKYAGFEQIRETGEIETPIALTSTLNMPRVADALISHAIKGSPHIGVGFRETGLKGYASVNAVVAECNDGYLNDSQSRRVDEATVFEALRKATMGPVEEGAVGGGTGLTCYNWKGGIGTASRRIPETLGGFTLGCLAQTNFGKAPDLTIAGVPVGQVLSPPNVPKPEGSDRSDAGSVVMILATDAPLDARQLERLCKRASFGLARTGSICETGSGDVVIAFSTAYRIPDRSDRVTEQRTVLGQEGDQITALGRAVVETVEEAVLNSLFQAVTITGRDGNTSHSLPVDETVALVKKHRIV